MKRMLALISVIGLLAGTTVWAGSLTVPNTFVSGNKALASEVNENFDEVEAEVTANAHGISSNAMSISNLSSTISSHSHSPQDVSPQGSSSNLDADTIDGIDSYALAPGVFPINASAFVNANWYYGYYFGSGGGPVWASVPIPFACTITGLEARVSRYSNAHQVEVKLFDGNPDTKSDPLTPLASVSTTGTAISTNPIIISSSPLSVAYDPVTMEPFYLEADFPFNGQQIYLYWVKIYYAIP